MSQLHLGAKPSLAFFTTSADEDLRIDAEEQELAVKKRRRQRPRRLALALAIVAGVALVPLTSAGADPSANDWLRLRVCESGNRYTINTGNGHYGAYQFDLATWKSVGGSGYPNLASPAEQDARALMLYRKRGWQPWQCARIVGLTNDSDAKSGRTGDIRVADSATVPITGTTTSSSPAPAWPGARTYRQGDRNSVIAAWQSQMNKRGASFDGTGQFGPKTVAAAKRLQRLNGLPVTGLLGPLTWALAWNGKY